MQCLLDVKAVDDLNHAGKQFLGDIPYPGGSVGNHDPSLRFTEASPACLPQHAFGEGGALFGGIRRGCALDSRRIGDGTLVAHRQPFAVARFRAPDSTDLHFPCFGGTVELFARTPGKFFGPHRNAGTIEAEVKGGRQRIFPQWPGVDPLIGGDLVAERFRAALHLTGVNANASQFPQQLAAFLKTDHRSNGSYHADGGRRKAGLLDTQMLVAWIESAAAMRTMIVGPIQLEFAQYALNNFYSASGIASGPAASAVQRRSRAIGNVGVEPLLDCARCQSQNLTPRSDLDGFEIHAVGCAGAQQRIQFNGDVASQFGGERVFFLNRPRFRRSRCAPHRSFHSLPPDRW